MTGIIGFIVGFLCIAGFAITASRTYITVPPRKLQLFTSAFALLAGAMLLWAFTIAINSPQSTKELILASDSLLLLGTGCMVLLLFSHSEVWLTTLLGLVGGMLVGLRAYAYPPTAFVHDGLLYFNLDPTVRNVIIGTFLLIWLPAVITVSSYIAKDKSLPGFQSILSLLFMSLIAVTILFLAARRSVVIIGLFGLLAALFLVMTVINLVIQKIHNSRRAEHAAKPAAR